MTKIIRKVEFFLHTFALIQKHPYYEESIDCRLCPPAFFLREHD